jgi:cytochrome oxidase assembly protein ShyY1
MRREPRSAASNARQLRTGLAVPTVFALVALATFIGLGTWQLQRKAWKEALIGDLEHRLAEAPQPLPARADWDKLDSARDEFRRVKFRAALVSGAEALVYASGSALRSDASGPGYWVFAPARLASGDTVVVNRGFVPEGRQDPATRSAGELAGPVEMVGVMRWPEPRGAFAPADNPAKNLWFVRDQMAMAAAKGWDKGWGAVAPFFVELESPEPPGGLPHPGALKPNLRNEHLQYAITWYGLAAVVVVMFAFWLRTRRA